MMWTDCRMVWTDCRMMRTSPGSDGALVKASLVHLKNEKRVPVVKAAVLI